MPTHARIPYVFVTFVVVVRRYLCEQYGSSVGRFVGQCKGDGEQGVAKRMYAELRSLWEPAQVARAEKAKAAAAQAEMEMVQRDQGEATALMEAGEADTMESAMLLLWQRRVEAARAVLAECEANESAAVEVVKEKRDLLMAVAAEKDANERAHKAAENVRLY